MRTAPKLVMGLLRPSGFDWSASSLVLPPGFTFTRSGTAGGLYGADFASAVISTYATDTPRFERLSDERIGLRIEGARTNLALRSGELGNGTVFTKSGITTADNIHVAPTGGTTAERYYPSSSTGAKRVYQSLAVTSGTTYSISCYFKQTSSAVRYVQLAAGTSGFGAEVYGNFDLQSGVVGTGGSSTTLAIMALPNGWYRCEIRGAATATTTDTAGIQIGIVTSASSARQASVSGFTGDATDDCAVWGLQAEAAAFRSSQIPTSGSTVTRNAETCSRSVTLPSGGFTVVYDVVTPPGRSADMEFANISDNSSANWLRFYQSLGAGEVACEINASSSTLGYLNTGAVTASTRYKLAMRCQAGAYAMSMNGGAPATLSSASYPSGMNKENLGSRQNGSSHFFGHILGCNYSPTVWRPPVSNAELQALSAVA